MVSIMEIWDGYFKDGKIEQALKAYNRAWKLNDQNAAVYASKIPLFATTGVVNS